MITHIIAEVHKKLAIQGSFLRAFLATGVWLPLDGSKDNEVELQGVPEYKYAEQVTTDKILAYQIKQCTDAKAKHEEKEAQEKKGNCC